MLSIKHFYTDGACIGNPGPGGWGLVVQFEDDFIVEQGEHQANTTNNRMEMQAAIAALEFLSSTGQKQPVTIYTDSEYVKKGITQWIHGWKKKGWKNSQGKPVVNQDLWETLDKLNNNLINWQYVKGHNGNSGNERADAIANGFARGNPPFLQQDLTLDDVISDSEVYQETFLGSLDQSNNPKQGYNNQQLSLFNADQTMIESSANVIEEQPLSRQERVSDLRDLIDTLRIADEIASKGYLITSSELADLMDINASAVTSRGDNWPWRNWVVSRVRREGNQILWQLERVD
jgi:ribonuclease HI